MTDSTYTSEEIWAAFRGLHEQVRLSCLRNHGGSFDPVAMLHATESFMFSMGLGDRSLWNTMSESANLSAPVPRIEGMGTCTPTADLLRR